MSGPDHLGSGGKPRQPLSCPYFLLWVFSLFIIYIPPTLLCLSMAPEGRKARKEDWLIPSHG